MGPPVPAERLGHNRLPTCLEALVETLVLAGHAPAAIDLNQPGTYL